jgi:hypothetical protein
LRCNALFVKDLALQDLYLLRCVSSTDRTAETTLQFLQYINWSQPMIGQQHRAMKLRIGSFINNLFLSPQAAIVSTVALFTGINGCIETAWMTNWF